MLHGYVAANSSISLRVVGNVARMVDACAVSLRVVVVDSLYLNHSTTLHFRNIEFSMIFQEHVRKNTATCQNLCMVALTAIGRRLGVG
jgi:hypothetical protein